ncbi:hypothetical protein [Sphingomonas sp. HMP9]|uniref:hypothetical protein n=1 Tax=Sphingomonas sp. HMP9 TaxID=1517554 RepID=UPI0015968898|nr:hypothetical protein [Sphingomonas sp. HMP9]
MAKRNTLNKKLIKFIAAGTTVPVVILRGKDRDSVNPGLSEKAVSKIERYEMSSQRAEQRLGTIRLR